MVCEAVTSAGVRPVFTQLKAAGLLPDCPIVLTSKGIEQKTGLLHSEVLLEVLGEQARSNIGCLSGPSHAEEVIKGLPTSVVCSAYHRDTMDQIQAAYNTLNFRTYTNSDLHGVQFGGAMKNIIAIACGLSDGLGFGDNTKAALMTRGLHEIRKLSVTKGARPETLNGLAGMGDLCVTCLSTFSRNYRFGRLIAQELSPKIAKEQIGVVIEGAYSCVSACHLGQAAQIAIPITQAVYQIIYEGYSPSDCVKSLLTRTLKEEHL
jgi:glycerol-3-phosphate dehydrogenase (NAD(P)+)